MRSTFRFAAVLGTLLACGVCAAQSTAMIGHKAPDFEYGDNPQSLKKFVVNDWRGWYLVFYFWRTNDVRSVGVLKDLQGKEGTYKTRGIRLIGVCADPQERRDKFFQEQGLANFEINFLSRGLHYLYGAMHEPSVVIVDPLGNIAWRGDVAGLDQRMDLLTELTPPMSADAKFIERRFKEADRFVNQGEISKAYTIARLVKRMTDEGSSENTKATSMMDALEGKASELLKEATKLSGEDATQGKAAYIVAQLAARFGRNEEDIEGAKPSGQPDQQRNQDQEKEKTQLVKDIDGEMGRMFGDRKLREKIDKELLNARGEMLAEWAAILEEIDRHELAGAIYKRIIDKHKETEVAKTAQAALDRIKKDKRIRQAIEAQRVEEFASRFFDIAERAEHAEIFDIAREYYTKVVKEYPKARVAELAEKRLNKLPPPESSTEAASAAPEKGTPKP